MHPVVGECCAGFRHGRGEQGSTKTIARALSDVDVRYRRPYVLGGTDRAVERMSSGHGIRRHEVEVHTAPMLVACAVLGYGMEPMVDANPAAFLPPPLVMHS